MLSAFLLGGRTRAVRIGGGLGEETDEGLDKASRLNVRFWG